VRLKAAQARWATRQPRFCGQRNYEQRTELVQLTRGRGHNEHRLIVAR